MFTIEIEDGREAPYKPSLINNGEENIFLKSNRAENFRMRYP